MSTLTSIARKPPRRPVVDADRELRAQAYWVGTLATSIRGHLNNEQPRDRLERDLGEFLGSAACSDELRKMLEPTKGTR